MSPKMSGDSFGIAAFGQSADCKDNMSTGNHDCCFQPVVEHALDTLKRSGRQRPSHPRGPTHFEQRGRNDSKAEPVGAYMDDRRCVLTTAISLPMLTAQEPICMASILAALSSPDAHATVAAAAYAGKAAQVPGDAAATAAAMMAFARSMTWTTDLCYGGKDPKDCLASVTGNGQVGSNLNLGSFPETNVPSDVGNVGRGRPTSPFISRSHSQASMPLRLLSDPVAYSLTFEAASSPRPTDCIIPIDAAEAASAADAVIAAALSLPCWPQPRAATVSCRRGLCEGTVRGGNPRNTWRYSDVVGVPSLTSF